MVEKEAVEEATGSGSEVVSTSVSVVGAENTLSTIRQLIISGDKGKIIGIYGMGGVGKTTLLTKIRGEMRTHFDVVISVTVSQEVNVWKIQKSIGDQLGYRLPTVELERARFLCGVLSHKNVLLLLDDLWEKLDLVWIGIPLPYYGKNRRCKVAFTTRLEEVCVAMKAQEKVKVMPLPESESWELFSSKIGDNVDLNNPFIKPLAKEVLAKCGGLPLALETVGKAMEDATMVEEWEKALKNLNNSPTEIQGMNNVFSILKKSYDRLRNDSLRWCLLYCVSFPSYTGSHEICIPDIVNYWVGEGIFSGDNRHELFNQACEVFEELTAACILEDCGDDYVTIHNGIHDMAVWISSGKDSDNPTNVIFSYAGLGLTQWPITERWGEAKLISLMDNDIETFPDDMPDCPHLSSLLISENPILKKPPESFFRYMPILRVLDLSYTELEELPKSIGLLVELQYLNLGHSNIQSLPEEMGNLKKLRDLLLCSTEKLETVPQREILKLSALQSLNLFDSKFIWDASDNNVADGSEEEEEEISFKIVEAFNQLEELGLTIATSRFLRVLLSSFSLSNAMKHLQLQVKDLTNSDLSTAWEYMKGLIDLQISSALELKELILNGGEFLNLRSICLFYLPMLTRIALNKEPVAMGKFFPFLTKLKIERCNQLSELLLDEGKQGDETDSLSCSVPNLKSLELGWLPKLSSISRRPLLLPSLKFISVYGCPKLKRLPFGPRSANNIISIWCTQIWWDELVWNPDTTKAFFLPNLTPDEQKINVKLVDIDDNDEEGDDDENDEEGDDDDDDENDEDGDDDENDEEGDDDDDEARRT